MARKNQRHRRDERRENAEFRNAGWAANGPDAQLGELRKRGHGHCKQARKLEEKVRG